MSTVERLAAPSVDAFRHEYFVPRRPVVLTGLTQHWPARAWTFESMSRRFGSATVSVAQVRDGALVTDARRGLSEQPMQLGAFLRELNGYAMTRLEQLPRELSSEVLTLPYAATANWQVSKLWISATGTTTAMHFDLSDNFHVVLQGRKRFTLVAREESACVYPRSLFSGLPNGAQVDPEHPDLVKFPRWNDAHPVIAELSAGDALYIPSRCWHHVRTLEASIAVNTWFASGPNALAARAADLFKRVRGLSR